MNTLSLEHDSFPVTYLFEKIFIQTLKSPSVFPLPKLA